MDPNNETKKTPIHLPVDYASETQRLTPPKEPGKHTHTPVMS